MHCAGDVSFDPPVDEGFRTNVVGTRDLLDRIREAGGDIHYVHISTAYVAGRRRGTIPEGRVDHTVDVEAELAWGLGQRRVVEHQSRSTAVLTKLRSRSEREHGRAGLLTAASAAEERRREWVKEQLVRIGTERARSLGWTDCYTFTKSLGERVVEEHARTARASIVRPSIIESALEQPYPGWIEGFKMAEPLILAYGRGELPEFPAAGDTIVDIVPVDHVVAAIVAVLAHPPEPGEPAYFHASSGARNPLTFRRLHQSVHTYFDEHPFEVDDRGAVRLPDWRFPGAQSVERLLSSSEKAHKVADYVIGRAPRGERTRDLARKLDQQGRRLEFLRRYLDLYREYAEAELRFDDAHTLALFQGLDEDDRGRFAFDTAVVDWDHYLREVHCPAVTEPIRQLDKVRRERRKAPKGGLKVLEPAPRRGWFRDRRQRAFLNHRQPPRRRKSRGVLRHGRHAAVVQRDRDLPLDAAAGPVRVGAGVGDRPDRGPAAGAGARRAAGAQRVPALDLPRVRRRAAQSDLDEVVDAFLTDHVLARLAPAAVRRVREHRAAGHPTILITGAIRPLTRPLAPLFDHIEAAELGVDERGRCTGFLAASPLVGESRSAWMRSWSAANGIDLAASYGYADSYSDLPLLEAVGNPVAVRPDVALFRHARRLRWNIVDWPSSPSTARTLNPAGDRA